MNIIHSALDKLRDTYAPISRTSTSRATSSKFVFNGIKFYPNGSKDARKLSYSPKKIFWRTKCM